MVYPALLPLMRTPQLPVVDWTDAPRRFKWIRPFRRKTKSGFCACAITFQTRSTTEVMALTHTAPHGISCLMPITLRYEKLWHLGWILRSYTSTKNFWIRLFISKINLSLPKTNQCVVITIINRLMLHREIKAVCRNNNNLFIYLAVCTVFPHLAAPVWQL
jgi:hypothetical protein